MSFFQNLSIGRKLTFIITVNTCVAILLAAAAFLTFDIYTFRHSKVRDLETLAQVVGSNSTAALTFGDASSGSEVLQALSAKEHILGGCVYGRNGQVFADYVRRASRGTFLCPPPESESSRFERGRLVVFRDVMLDGQQIGTVFLASDLEEMSQLVRVYLILL